MNTVHIGYKIGICPGGNVFYIQIYLISSYFPICRVEICSKESLSTVPESVLLLDLGGVHGEAAASARHSPSVVVVGLKEDSIKGDYC